MADNHSDDSKLSDGIVSEIICDKDFNNLEILDERVDDLCKYIGTENDLQVLSISDVEPKRVRTLNLTNTGITSVSEWIFIEAKGLEILDLSHNMLTDLSNMKNIDLPHLKKFNLKENNISNFTFLSKFHSLEDLDISGNKYDITVPYWVVTILPKLKKFNGEDVTEIRKYISMAELQVITNIDKIFSNNFTPTLNETESGIMKLKNDFTENLLRECGVINEAKSALKHKVEQFFDNKLKSLLRDITQKVSSSRSISNNIQIMTTTENSQILDNTYDKLERSVNTTHSTDSDVDILAQAIAQEIGDLSVLSIITSPTKSSSKNNYREKRKEFDEKIQPNDKRLKRSQFHTESNISIHPNSSSSYEPKYILREHSRKWDPNDNSTPIWNIQFKPKTRKYSGNEIVATCGGNIVNIIDLKSGSVNKRYEDDNQLETFNCIAWRDFSIISKNAKIREISLLAIGGTKKDKKHSSILFLNENNMKDYFKIASHVNSVNSLLFHPKRRNYLFSGSFDRKIILWELEWTKLTLTSKLSSMKAKKLLEFDCNNRILSLVFSVQFNVLIAAGEDGISLIKDPSIPTHESRMQKVELPDKKKLVDGLVLIDEKPNLMAFRYKQHIIVADLEKMVSSMKIKDSKPIPLLRVTQLSYSQQKCDYFYVSIQSRLLSCGDANGLIFLYSLNDSVLNTRNKNLIEPNEVLEMPRITNKLINNKQLLDNNKPVFVNIAAISPNHEYIVSGTNTNLICVWHKKTGYKMHTRIKTTKSL